MLARASPPSINLKFSRKGSLYRKPLIPFLNGGNLLQSRSYNSGVKWTSRRKGNAAGLVVVVRAGYSRRQMETPGAYELIDDETGDKVIVWGGIDDDNNTSSIPAKEILHWKPTDSPKDKNRSRNTTATATTTVRGGEEARVKRLVGNFGRLKAQRVRDLAKATSSAKKVINIHDYDEKVLDDSSYHTSRSSRSNRAEVKVKQRRFNVLKEGTYVSRARRSEETQDMKQKGRARKDMKHFELDSKDGVEQLSMRQTKPEAMQVSDTSVSDSRVSAASFRGWGGGVPMSNYEYNRTDILKKGKKLNVDSDFFSRKSFRDMGCSDYMIESLRNRLFVRPSHIQAMAFAPVVEGKSCIIADQSGSGKTLAYLIPVIQRLRQEELQGLGKSVSQSPRVVILVPTAELASQVLNNCRLMSKFGVPFRSMVVTGGFRQRTQLENLRQDLDVIIATPGRFTFLVKEGFLQLTNLTCAVLDEVDILYSDEDFESALQTLMNSSPFTTQYLFVTATLPVNIYNNLVEVFPDCEVIMGPGMHRTSAGLEEILVDCSGDDGAEKTPDTAFLNKKLALLQLVEERPVAKTIVFCNKIETCRKVENALQRFDRKGSRTRVLPFHAALAQESRLSNIEEFHSSQLKDSSLFLVCTDRASRGIDFAGVDHVVLFDFPRDPSEYVRRVGRTARGAGGTGKAFIFVVGKQVSLARRIIERNRKGHPLHDVPSAYEQMR